MDFTASALRLSILRQGHRECRYRRTIRDENTAVLFGTIRYTDGVGVRVQAVDDDAVVRRARGVT